MTVLTTHSNEPHGQAGGGVSAAVCAFGFAALRGGLATGLGLAADVDPDLGLSGITSASALSLLRGREGSVPER